MAGLGEASAIISVAQVGISLSFTLISFIGDVRDARKRIKIVADEISLTAQRLKELGNLIEKNDRTKFFGEDSLKSTFTLAKGCEVALTEIRLVLKKASVTVDPTEAKKDEIEIGSFSNWLWPWTKVQLAPPRADLATLKDDLQLLYLSVMANNASTAAERSKYVQSIPGFYRSRQSAAAERDRALQRRSESSKQRPSRHSREGNPGTLSDEEDLLQQELHDFRQNQLAEENEKRIREQAKLLKLEDEKKAREEEEKVKEIERRAVEEWKVKTAEEEEKRQNKLEESRDRLKKRLLQEHLSNDQIESILGIVTIEDPLTVETGSGREGSPNSNHNKAQTITRIVERNSPKPESRLSRIFSYLREGSLRSSTYTSSISSLASSHTPSVLDLGPDFGTKIRFEAWALKQDPHQQTRVPLPGRWIEQHATKKICPSKSLLKRFSFLHPYYKTQINELIEEKNAEETTHGWFLVSLQAVNKVLRENLFRRHEVEICVLIVLGRLRTDYAYSTSDSDISSVSSTTRRPRRPFPTVSQNARRPEMITVLETPVPAPGPSSAPPPPPGIAFPFQLPGPPPPLPPDVIPPARPPAGIPDLGSSYGGSTFPTREQSSYRSVGPPVTESTRPPGSTEPWLSNNPPRPVPHSHNTGLDESRPRVSFATDERESGPHSGRRRRPYGSAFAAGWSGPTGSSADGAERTGGEAIRTDGYYDENWPAYPYRRRVASMLSPDWDTYRRPPYRPEVYKHSDSSHYARETGSRGSRPAVHSEYAENDDWYSHRQGPADGGKRPPHSTVTVLPDEYTRTLNPAQFSNVTDAEYPHSGDPIIRVANHALIHLRAQNGTSDHPYAEREWGPVPMQPTPRRPTWARMSSEETPFKHGDRDGQPPLRNTTMTRHGKILPKGQSPGRPGRRRASAIIDATSDFTSTSDDDHESATLDFEKRGEVMSRENSDRNKDNDKLAKEPDEEIIKRYLTRYTSMHDVAVNAPSHADGDPAITHTGTVADASNITGQVFDEPRTLDAKVSTSVAGTEDLGNEVIRPIDRSDSIPSVVEPGPHMGSVSPSVVERSSHEGSIPQLPPNTSILDRS